MTANCTYNNPATKPFPFLKLPVEIRTRIYKLVLIFEEPIKIDRRLRRLVPKSTTRSGKSLRSKTDEAYRSAISGYSALAIKASCRQVYLEAVSIYYAYNAFECVRQAAFSEFLADIGTTNVRLIANVHATARHFRYFRRLTEVRSLTIFISDFDSKVHVSCCFARALQEFSETCPTLEVVVVHCYMQGSNGTMEKGSMRWPRGTGPNMDAFLGPLTELYHDSVSSWCTPWST